MTVVSPDLNDELRDLDVTWREGRYRRSDLRGAFLVVAATSDRSVNERVHRDAEARAMLCNVADVPDLCNFILPAVHREGPIAVAVSTGGASPALAKRIRDDVAAIVSSQHAELALRLQAMRPEVKERFPSYTERRDYFENARRRRRSRDGLPRRRRSRRSGADHGARARARSALRRARLRHARGARSSSREAPDGALLVPRAGVDQESLNELLVELGRDGLETVRLKGGDPFVFGRGGEEAAALAEADVPFEVVPGVSALASVPAAFDIPVTHRGVAAQVTLVSGHSASGDDLDFSQLAQRPARSSSSWACVRCERIVEGLIAHGKDPQTPAAIVARGTLPDGELAEGVLCELPELARGIAAAALVVIGDVVALRHRLAARLVSQTA